VLEKKQAKSIPEEKIVAAVFKPNLEAAKKDWFNP